MLSKYLAVLRAPGGARLFGGVALVRVGFAGNVLLIVLFARDVTGSFGPAGVVAGCYTLGFGLTSPLLGRIADRRGQTFVILPTVVAYSIGIAVLIGAGLSHAPAGALAAIALVTGAAQPPVAPFARPLLRELVGHDEAATTTAYALDAIIVEVGFTSGPPIGAGIVAVASAAVAVGMFAAVVVGGALLFASSPPSRASRRRDGDAVHGSPLREVGLRTLVIASLLVGGSFGTLDVSMPAFAGMHGSRSEAGIILALIAIASAAGGLVYGSRQHDRRELHRVYLFLVFVLPATFALMLAASSMVEMGVFAFIAGLGIAPFVATQNELVNDVAPQTALTEAFTWISLGLTAGVAIGDGIAGGLVAASGWRAGLAAGALLLVVAAAITGLRRHSLVVAT